MNAGLFVTGTDTNIGKTVLAAALLQRYRSAMPLRYWKPIQTGVPQDDDTRDVRKLGACSDAEICDSGIRLPRPLSPHLSAKLGGVQIDLQTILTLASVSAGWIVEGAGGLLVPLNRDHLMIDLIAALNIAVVIMARSQLGTINHTLLTLEALRARSIPIGGVVLGGEPNRENRVAIETYGDVLVLGEMPLFPDLSAQVLGDWARAELDPASHLQRFLAGSVT
jgi:dethiobiotin synthetase